MDGGRAKSVVRSYQLRIGGAVAITVVYALAGTGLAAGTLLLDDLLGTDTPVLVRMGEEPARNLLITLSGAYVTVGAIVFWVRIYAVQLAAGPLTSRVLRLFLMDPVQRNAMGLIVGALAFNLVTLRGVPSTGAGLEQTPNLAMNIAALLAVITAGTIMFAVENAARLGQAGTLIRWLSDSCIDVIRSRHPEYGEGVEDPSTPTPGEPGPGVVRQPVRARENGWIQAIDTGAILDVVPAGASVEVTVSVGAFVNNDLRLCDVITTDSTESGHGSEYAIEDAVRNAFEIGNEPALHNDLAYGIRELVDIADRSMNPSTQDTTASREIVLHLGVVLRELLIRDLPSPFLTGPRGRRLVLTGEPSFRDYINEAFDRIRAGAEPSIDLTRQTLATIEMLESEASGLDGGNEGRLNALRAQARLLLAGAEQQLATYDFERVLESSRLANQIHALESRPQ